MAETNSKPAYVLMADILSQQIHSGVYQAGQRLPSEISLSQRYGLSPMTVRRAVKYLAETGLIKSVHGSGTYVSRLNLQESAFNFNIFKSLFDRGPQIKVKLLDANISFATQQQAERLQTMPGIHLVALTRLITTDGEPIAVHNTYFVYDPEEPSIESELNITSLHGLLVGESHAAFKKGDMAFQAITLGDKDARLLGEDPGGLAYSLEVVFYNFDDRPVNYGQLKIPCRHITIENKIGLWKAENSKPMNSGA